MNERNLFERNLFAHEIEQEAITRIQKFARIAKAMDLPIHIGFSGGKDSQVVLDLCKRAGIEFTAYFNHALESPDTLKFIREQYPEVIWRRDVKEGLIQHIREVCKGFLPTVQAAYCCETYKHNPKYVDKCTILGIRKSESAKRANRTAFTAKNKTTLKKNKTLVSEYFKEQCQSVGSASLIALHPIIDWSVSDVWGYIKDHNLPINPEYAECNRVGCMICPKANFNSNYIKLKKYPKLIDALIKARDFEHCDWIITAENKDYRDDKVYYICRWLNHSFMPFTERNQRLYEEIREIYNQLKRNQ